MKRYVYVIRVHVTALRQLNQIYEHNFAHRIPRKYNLILQKQTHYSGPRDLMGDPRNVVAYVAYTRGDVLGVYKCPGHPETFI